MCAINKKPREKSSFVNDCDLSLVSKQVKTPVLPRKKVDFSGWKKIRENNGGGKVGNDGTMNDQYHWRKAKPEKFNHSLTQVILHEAYLKHPFKSSRDLGIFSLFA